MNNNINIAEILENCPKGTKLYSTIFGEVTFDRIDRDEKYPIIVYKIDGMKTSFSEEGHYTEYRNSECILFPSKEMRDWTKFFKRGDILTDGDIIALFEEWVDSSYRRFKTSLFMSGNKVYNTESTYNVKYFKRAPKAQQEYFIKNTEAFYNGKYNPITLQVEPIKSKCEFKPFDKVLVRNNTDEEWSLSLFSYYDEKDGDFPYICLNRGYYHYCIPYEGNEYLLGKTINPH